LWSACAIGLVGGLVRTLSLMMHDTESLKLVDFSHWLGLSATNLAFLLPSDGSAPLRALVRSFDVFSIWYVILLIIGLAAIAGSKKITKSKTATVVITLWVIGILLVVGLASMGFA